MQRIWTAFLSPFGDQVGLINIDLGRSAAPEDEITPEEAKAIRAFETMLEAIADIEEDHARPAFRP